MGPTRREQLRRTSTAMDDALSYDQWLEAAEAFDRAAGLHEWREDHESPLYHAPLIEEQLRAFRRLRNQGLVRDVLQLLHEGLARNLGDLTAPALYETARSGTKRLVTAYIDETVETLGWLGQPDLEEASAGGVGPVERLQALEMAYRAHGRSALMLSGGAGLGFYHLGVIKGLLSEGLLPDVISGSSTGAMVAAWACAKPDAELTEALADPRRLQLDGLQVATAGALVRSRAILDGEHLYSVLRRNIGDLTFEEAVARSGRTLNISVSPTQTHQRPRLLSALTSPTVLVANAVLASSALPGLFPPVRLVQRDHTGKESAYIPTERWIDGSVNGDLPMRWVARLHNVTNFIVSQTNPHITPFVRYRGRRGVVALAAGLVSSTVRVQGAHAADVASRLPMTPTVKRTTQRIHALLTQEYRGDIDIFPPFEPAMLTRILMNPGPEDLTRFVDGGERATWPMIARIRDQARIRVGFEKAIARLRAHVREDGTTAARGS